ncbi:hypothetical protein [Vibrio sp. SCSIO 43086]|uniref:hypothetical protein n=1 Tax=Vibrio sp. SCSIO 43086 TaxID=2822845 RepID=UPI003DA81760
MVHYNTVFWVIFSILVALYASGRKGRSGLVFFLISIFLSPILGGIIALIVSPNEKVLEEKALSSGHYKKCLKCSELVKREASVCKHCGSELNGFNFDDLPDIQVDPRIKNEQDWQQNS